MHMYLVSSSLLSKRLLIGRDRDFFCRCSDTCCALLRMHFLLTAADRRKGAPVRRVTLAKAVLFTIPMCSKD
jgi:hypothetical protein